MQKIVIFIIATLSFTAFAETPDRQLAATVQQLVADVAIPDQTQRYAQLCQLVTSQIDLPTISGEILGQQFGTLTRDQAGIDQFNALLPSIVVTTFYSLVSDKGGQATSVNPAPVPKGSERTGYRVTIGGTTITVTLLKANNKIVDADWAGISVVKIKERGLQQQLQQSYNANPAGSMPVSDLVKSVEAENDLIHCP
jgi:ABC-type transporter MlaC component